MLLSPNRPKADRVDQAAALVASDMNLYTRLGSPTSFARLTMSLYEVTDLPSPVGRAPASKSSVSWSTLSCGPEPVKDETRSRTSSPLRSESPFSYTRARPLD